MVVGEGFVRVGEGEGWVVSVYGGEVYVWDVVMGRNMFWVRFLGKVKDLEVMEMMEVERKDVLVFFEEEEKGEIVLRWLNVFNGDVVWEFREVIKDVLFQVSMNVEKVFVVFLKGIKGVYSFKVMILDMFIGKRLDELVIGIKVNLNDEGDIMFVGVNLVVLIVVWIDVEYMVLRVNVLGLKMSQEFFLFEGIVEVEIYVFYLIQLQLYFLVYSKIVIGNKGEVYYIDLKIGYIVKVYNLFLFLGKGVFVISLILVNVYFMCIIEDELILVLFQFYGVFGCWFFKNINFKVVFIYVVFEVIKKVGVDGSYVVWFVVFIVDDEWVFVCNGEIGWICFEGFFGGVVVIFVEIFESEELVKFFEQEVYSNLV